VFICSIISARVLHPGADPPIFPSRGGPQPAATRILRRDSGGMAHRGAGLSEVDASRRFEAMAAPHLDAAYNLARWLTRNPHDADDVVQEAYLRAFRFFGGFHGGDGRAWLLAIVRNTFYTWLEKRRHEANTVEYDDAGSLELDVAVDDQALHGSDPQRLLLRAADQALIERALLRLPAEHREILVLRELEEMSYKEIAEIVGLAMGTVMSRLSRARLRLRQELEAMGGP
jgi:RNA polymerase sigma-70 factor (ECF subfamily)